MAEARALREGGDAHARARRTLAIALLATLLVSILSLTQGDVAGSQTKAPKRSSITVMARYEKQLAAAINSTRKRHGLRALKLVPGLMRSADRHSLQMACNGYFAHSSPNGASFITRVKRFYGSAGSSYYSAGENILWAQPRVNPRGVVARWLASPEHRRVMLSRTWRVFGIGVVSSTRGAGIFGGHTVMLVTGDFAVKR
ncbi:MAG: CAP domain-containing protein [Gaiellaceae bacterium]